ncbi:MAG: glycerol-3-phosphate dehydrogenase [Alphaproteobacteria bacterium]
MTYATGMPVNAVDLVVVGGGINGTGIACDAAGKGLSVVLCEQGDLGGATSSASSKLIHGGLRYLEHYAFRLVHEALCEREVLLNKAAHIIRPLSFVLVHDAHMRPAWMIRLGLLLYDTLARRRILSPSRGVDLTAAPEGAPLADGAKRGFIYADAWVDDARLVILNALAAAERGAQVLTRTECTSAKRIDGAWRVSLRHGPGGESREITARALVNAAGPWVTGMLGRAGAKSVWRQRLVKGSHIVVPRLYDGDHAYVLQQPDRRIVFAIPFEEDYTLIGTTDIPFSGDPAEVAISPQETHYLCAAVNTYFRHTLAPDDVVWSYAGVRPLLDDDEADPAAITRDYMLDVDCPEGAAPLLSVVGGKITTYRVLAEAALGRLRPWFPDMGPSWTATATLPGGDLPAGGAVALAEELIAANPWLPPPLARRYASSYGTRARELLSGAGEPSDLGTDFGSGLHERELAFLMNTEWAQTVDDVLWRRTKLGLRFTDDERRNLTRRMARD